MSCDAMIVKIENGEFTDSVKRVTLLLEAMDSEFIPRASPSFELENYIRKIISNGNVFIYRDNGEDLGYIAIYTNNLQERTAFITSIGVLPAFRGNHIGQKLIEFAFLFAKKQGMSSIELEVSKKNALAIAAYQKNGFIFSKKTDKDSFILKKIL